MNESKILSLFQEGKKDKAFQLLYKLWPQFLGYVTKQGSSKEQAEDVFQDAIFVFYKRLSDQKFVFEGSLKTYLFNTAKYLWWKENKNKREVEVISDFLGEESEELEFALEKEAKIQKAEQAIESLGEKCQQILEAFYYKGMRMVEIAKQFGYGSEKSAKNQKYKCLERARKQLLNA